MLALRGRKSSCLMDAAGYPLSAVCPPLVTAPQSVTLTIKLIAAKGGDTTTLSLKGCQT